MFIYTYFDIPTYNKYQVMFNTGVAYIKSYSTCANRAHIETPRMEMPLYAT